MEVFHGSTLIVDSPLVGVGRKDLDFGLGFYNTIELYDSGLITREEALNRLRYEKPNNQICIIRQELVDRYLLFKEAVLLNNGQ